MKRVFNIAVMTVIVLIMSAIHIFADWKLAGEERIFTNLAVTIVIEASVCAMVIFAYSRKKILISVPMLVLVILACDIVIFTVGNPFDFKYSRSSTWVKLITELIMYGYAMVWAEKIRNEKMQQIYEKVSETQYVNVDKE